MPNEFDQCCGCIPLRTGSLLIGYLHLVAEIAITVACALAIAARPVDVFLNILLSITLLFVIITLILLLGLYKNKRSYVRAYLIFAPIYMLLTIIILICNVTKMNLKATDIVMNIFSGLLAIYYYLVINRYYLQMDDPSSS